jgi:hypothetical protein
VTNEPGTETQAPRRDLLLTSARWLVKIILALVCLIGLGLLTAAVALLVFEPQVLAKVFEETGKQAGREFTIALEAIFALLFVAGTCAYRWLRQLGRIIDSVAHGEAFAPINAERLAQMGWLTIGIEGLAIPAGAIMGYLTHHYHQDHIDISMSLSGILLALILFILARVFRQGAAMREELEGTV